MLFTSFPFNHCIVWWQSTVKYLKYNLDVWELNCVDWNLGIWFSCFASGWNKTLYVRKNYRISLISWEGKRKRQVKWQIKGIEGHSYMTEPERVIEETQWHGWPSINKCTSWALKRQIIGRQCPPYKIFSFLMSGIRYVKLVKAPYIQVHKHLYRNKFSY